MLKNRLKKAVSKKIKRHNKNIMKEKEILIKY